MSDLAFRTRSVAELLDATIQIYKRNFGSLVMTGALTAGPVALVQMLLVAAFPGYAPTTALSPNQPPTAIEGYVVGALFNWVAYALMGGVIVRAAADAYNGGDVDPIRSFRAVFPRTPRLMGAAFLKTIAIMLPMMAVAVVMVLFVTVGMTLFAPTATSSTGAMLGVGLFFLIAIGFGFAGFFYMFGRYVAVNPAVVLENVSAGDSLKRSTQLTRGHVWHYARALALGSAIVFAFYIGVAILGPLMPAVLQILFIQAFVVMLFPAYFILEMLAYFDARIRGEALDLELSVNSLGAAPIADDVAS